MHTSTTRTGRFLLAGAALAVAALAGGCSSGASSPGASAPPATTPANSAPATSAPATSASASASAGTTAPAATGTATIGAGSSSPSGAGGAPACASADLRVSAGPGQGAAGSLYQSIDFTNLGSAPCTLYGYPGVSQAGGSPVKQIGAAADRDASSHPKLVTLPAHGTANATLRITNALNYPSAECGPVTSTYLRIYPPNQTASLLLSFKSTACSRTSVKLMMIGVVQPGAGTGS